MNKIHIIIYIGGYGIIMKKYRKKLFKFFTVTILTMIILVTSSISASANMMQYEWQYNDWIGWSYVKSGTYVTAVQSMLYSSGYGSTVGAIDGYYGNATHNAIMYYQRDRGMTADGVVGTQTWLKFEASRIYTGSSSTGSAVYYTYRGSVSSTFYMKLYPYYWYVLKDGQWLTVYN